MVAAGNFRHHAAEPSVDFDLRSDDVRQNFPAVSDHRRRGFVTAGFDCQNDHVFFADQFFKFDFCGFGVVHQQDFLRYSKMNSSMFPSITDWTLASS